MTFETWLTFAVVFFMLSLPVGPNAIHTIATAVSVGLPKGFLVPLGMGIASVIHALLASLGFGALLLVSADLFAVLKWLGAAYLLWLAIRLWRSPPANFTQSRNGGSSAARLLASGCFVSLGNPKAILSYLAVFPPFISAQAPLGPQLAVMMPTATAIVVFVYSCWALLAFPLGKWAISSRRLRIFNRSAAAFYFLGAGALATASRQ